MCGSTIIVAREESREDWIPALTDVANPNPLQVTTLEVPHANVDPVQTAAPAPAVVTAKWSLEGHHFSVELVVDAEAEGALRPTALLTTTVPVFLDLEQLLIRTLGIDKVDIGLLRTLQRLPKVPLLLHSQLGDILEEAQLNVIRVRI